MCRWAGKKSNSNWRWRHWRHRRRSPCIEHTFQVNFHFSHKHTAHHRAQNEKWKNEKAGTAGWVVSLILSLIGTIDWLIWHGKLNSKRRCETRNEINSTLSHDLCIRIFLAAIKYDVGREREREQRLSISVLFVSRISFQFSEYRTSMRVNGMRLSMRIVHG